MQFLNISIPVKVEYQDYKKAITLINRKTYLSICTIMVFYALITLFSKDFSGFAGIIFLTLIYGIWNNYTWKKNFKSSLLTNKEKVVQLNENEISITYTDGSSGGSVKWEELYGAMKDNDTLFLMTGKGAGLIIPTRFYSDQKQIVEGVIKDKLGDKAFQKQRLIRTILITAGCVAAFIVALILLNALLILLKII